MTQDPYEEMLRQEAKLMKTVTFWGRIFNGVAGFTIFLYLLAAFLLVVPLLICCGMFTWDVIFKK